MNRDDIPMGNTSDQPQQQAPEPTTPPRQTGNSSDSSPLSSPPSVLETPTPLLKQRRPQVPPSPQPIPIPEGYKINSITGNLMVDPKSRDYVKNFRKMYHPDVDFSSGQYIDPKVPYAYSRHVPPNVPKKGSPWAAPLGSKTAGDEERYLGPPGVEMPNRKPQMLDSVKVKAARERLGKGIGKGKGKAKEDADEEVEDEAEDEQGDTTLSMSSP